MKILYVEDEIAHVELTQRTLEDNLQVSFVLLHAESLKDAIKTIATETDIDLVLTDLRLPDGSGLELLKSVQELPAPPAVVLVTGQGDQEVAVAALKAGAADYLVKQSDYLHRLPVVISNAVAQNRLAHEQGALREAQARFRTLVEQIPAAVYTDLADQHITRVYISPQIEEISGYSPQDWMQSSQFVKSIIHPEDKARYIEEDDITNQNGTSFNLEYRIFRKDGQIRTIHDTATLVYDENGKPLYWQGIIFDITKERESQETIKASERSYRGLFNSISQAIYIHDKEGRFLDVNEGAVLMYGYPREFFIGKTPEVLSAPGKNDLNEVKQRLQKAFFGEPQEFEFWGIRSNGEVFPKDVTLNKGTYFGQDVIIAIGQDITLRKRAEGVLEYQLKELSVLHAAASAGVQSTSEEEVIESITRITAQIYPEVCGILLLNQEGNLLTPHRSYLGADVSNWQTGYPITMGITGKAVSTGTIQRIGDITQAKEFIEIASNIKSELCVPIRVNKRIIGVLNVESKQPYAFDEEDERLLSTIADGLGTALERLRLFNEERRRANEFTALYATTSKLTTKWDLQSLMETVLSQAIELLNSTGGGIYLYNEARGDLEVAVARGVIMRPGVRLQLGEGMAGKVAQSLLPLIVDDYESWEYRSIQYANKSIRAVVEVPMQYGGKLIGVLAVIEVDKSTRKFTESDVELLSLFAAQATSAIENVRLFEAEKHRRQEAETLRQAASTISSTLELDAVVTEILTTLKRVVPYDSGSIFFHEGNQLRIVLANGFANSDQLKNRTFSADNELFQIIQSTGRPLIIEDVSKDRRFMDWGISAGIRGWMAVPLITRGHVIGYITLDNHEPNTYNESTGDTAMAFAYQAAAAIDNARLYDETQRRLRELEIINRISTSLRLTQSVEEMLPILLNEALLLANTSNGSIWLYDSSSNTLAQRIARGTDAKLLYKALKPGEGIVGYVFTTGEKYISSELKSDPLLSISNRDSMTPGLSGICIPIQSTVGPVGVLIAAIEMDRQISEEINLLTILAEITGNAIHRVELFGQSQEQIHKLTTLRDIDAAIASSTDLRVTLNILMDHTIKHLRTDAVDIMLYHPELQSLTYLCSSGFNNPSPSRPLMRLGEGLAGQVVMKGAIEYVPDIRTSNEVKRDPMLIREGFVTYIGIPLIVKGQIKGVFEIFHRSPMTPSGEWMQFLQTLAGQAAIAVDNAQLFDHLQRSNQEVTQAYDTTLEGWARALELRDRETEGHTRRVTELTMQLARFMEISDDELVNIYRGVLLHDIGKMGVPDQILRKTGPLIESEWVEMRKHPEYAFNLLAPIPYLRPALDIPYCHHEHWDGSGYPRGLKGEQIPLSARIFSIVDIWDALLSDRVYRKAWPEAKVFEYLKEISGTILDPKVVNVFFKMMGVTE